MNGQIRQTLRDLYISHGASLLDDPSQLRTHLSGIARRLTCEEHLITKALEARVPQKLVGKTGSLPMDVHRRLVNQLVNEYSITEDAANWTVGTWAQAIGLSSEPSHTLTGGIRIHGFDNSSRPTMMDALIQRGSDAFENPKLCQAVLRDRCPNKRRECFVIALALKGNAYLELSQCRPEDRQQRIRSIAKNLAVQFALRLDAAEWGVTFWNEVVSKIEADTIWQLQDALRRNDDGRLKTIFLKHHAVIRGNSSIPESLHGQLREALGRSIAPSIRAIRRAIEQADDHTTVTEFDQNETIVEASGVLSEQEHRQVALAKERLAALNAFQDAVKTENDARIVACYRDILDNHPLPMEQRDRLKLARQREEVFKILDAAITADDDNAIAAVAYDQLKESSRITSGIDDRVKLAHKRIAALNRWREALCSHDPHRIANDYDSGLLDHCKAITSQERTKLAEARRIGEVKCFLDRGDLESAIRYSLQLPGAVNISRLSAAKKRFVTKQDPTRLSAYVEDGLLRAQWEWPTSELIEYCALVWRDDSLPESPHDTHAMVKHMLRAEYHRLGKASVRLSHVGDRVFVRVFSAMKLDQQTGVNTWLYSIGDEPTSRTIAGVAPKLLCSIRRHGRSSQAVLSVRTRDSTLMPGIAIVKKAHGLPMSLGDGQLVYQVPANVANKLGEVALPISQDDERDAFRVFATFDDNKYFPVSGKLKLT